MTQEVGFLISRVTSGFRSSTSGHENSIISPLSCTLWKLHAYSCCSSISSPCCYSNVALLSRPNSQVYLLSTASPFFFSLKTRAFLSPQLSASPSSLALYLVASAPNFQKKKILYIHESDMNYASDILRRVFVHIVLFVCCYHLVR